MPRLVIGPARGLLGIGLLGVLFLASGVGAQAPDTNSQEGRIARRVAQFVERGHFSRPKIDDNVSKKWFKNYLTMLDPLKYNFVKGDVEEFSRFETELDNKLQSGDLSVGIAIMDRFKARAKQRLEDATEILKTNPDFTIDETIVDDPDRLDWPATEAEAKERLRKLIKYDLLRAKILGDSEEEAAKRIGIRYRDRYRLYRDLDASEMLEIYLTAMATVIDPHSGYMSPRNFEDFQKLQLELTIDGIGASLSVEDGYPIVREIVPEGAADKDGRLQLDDKILGIENADGSKEDFVEKKLNDVVRKIRGPRGSKVRLIVQPAGSKDVKTYELTRQKIDLVESKAKSKVIEATVEGREKPLKIGILNVPGFYGDTEALQNNDPNATSITSDCRKQLNELKRQGVDVVVMDLRGNPGGLLVEAVSLSGLFIDRGPVVQIREASGVKHMDDEEQGTAWDGPLVVLIDKTSASASEIFAGVIKDYSRGLIIGDASTYGKGTVQTLIPVAPRLDFAQQGSNQGALKLTIQQFYRVNGASTQIKGVEPDIHIPSMNDHADLGEGKNESAMAFDQIPAMPHDQYNRAPQDLIAQLATRSEARRNANEKFQEDAKFVEKLIDRKKRHEISLNEAKFRAEVRAEKDDDERTKNPDGTTKRTRRRSNRDVWESNHYNDEIIAITTDYMTLGGRLLIAAPVRAANVAEPPALMP